MVETAKRYDVIIAGGGGAGLALACALDDALGGEARIAVVDRGGLTSETVADPRAFALSAGSQRLLTVLGVWPAIADYAQPVTAIDITDSSLDDAFRPVLVSYDNSVEGEPATWIVEHLRLQRALLERAEGAKSIALLGGAAAEGFAADEHGVTVELADGSRLRTALLVAADGRRSRLREAAGIKVVRWSYPQTGIVVTVQHEKPHQGRAVQHFLPGGPLAILPLTGNRSCITWTESADRAREILALDDAGFLREVERRFDYRLGGVALAGPRRRLASRHAPGTCAGRQPLRADQRCRSRRAPDRRPGSEPRPARCGSPCRSDRRSRASRPGLSARSPRWSDMSAGVVSTRPSPPPRSMP